MKKKAALHNLGCKVNAYETEAMRQLLEEAGYEIVPFAPGADVYVINTCTVTNIADRKSRQMLHKARRMNPEAIVVAAGCYVQTAGEEDSSIDIVLGNNRKKDLIEALQYFEEVRRGKGNEPVPENAEGELLTGKTAKEPLPENTEGELLTGKTEEKSLPGNTEKELAAEIPDSEETGASGSFQGKIDINHTKEYEALSITRTEEHTRAYIKVQDGCNQFCSYCIIPYARGRVRSREMEDVLKEVRALAEFGCREVVLTGIHLSSYGTDLGTTLLALIEAVHGVRGISRIRLGSLEPGIVTEEFARSLAALPKICPHFHLSLQSGCDGTLKRMNRRYTAREYREKCRILREAFEGPALTTDVIVGFPGETEEEFQTTVEFLKELKLYETHIFKYSRRQGTRAAAMPDQIPETVKAKRSDCLIALGDENRRIFEESWIGREVSVLFEEEVEIQGKNYFSGYTKEYIRVVLPADQDYSNVERKGKLAPGPGAHIFQLI